MVHASSDDTYMVNILVVILIYKNIYKCHSRTLYKALKNLTFFFLVHLDHADYVNAKASVFKVILLKHAMSFTFA